MAQASAVLLPSSLGAHAVGPPAMLPFGPPNATRGQAVQPRQRQDQSVVPRESDARCLVSGTGLVYPLLNAVASAPPPRRAPRPRVVPGGAGPAGGVAARPNRRSCATRSHVTWADGRPDPTSLPVTRQRSSMAEWSPDGVTPRVPCPGAEGGPRGRTRSSFRRKAGVWPWDIVALYKRAGAPPPSASTMFQSHGPHQDPLAADGRIAGQQGPRLSKPRRAMINS